MFIIEMSIIDMSIIDMSIIIIKMSKLILEILQNLCHAF